jgi:hypothetical protein
MWTTILTAALPFILKMLGWYLDKINADKKAKEAYLDFLKHIEPHNKACVRLRKSYVAQRDANLEKLRAQ